MLAAATMVALASYARAQTNPADTIKILKPTVDKSAGTVTLPAAFWNPHAADWVEVALSGRPSDFLHETVVCTTTTRTLLEQALRDIGCRDGDAWADSVADFPRLRGDRLMVLLSFDRNGNKETFSLDELLEYQGWGVALGPYGFEFKGDPDHSATTHKPGEGETDATRILKDDPQIAIQFKGLQSVSQSFADHPLAYDDTWQFETINWGRNYAVLPDKVYDSNGDIPVTMTFKHVNEEQLLTESAKVWHDKAAADMFLKQMPVARQIDKEKEDYLKLRGELKGDHDKWTQEMQKELDGHIALLLADITRDYAVLDAAWANWSFDHIKWDIQDPMMRKALETLAGEWHEHINLEVERTNQLAVAQQASYDAAALAGQPATDQQKTQLAALRGKEIEARSKALLADNKQAIDRWAAELARLDMNDPRSDWVNEVKLHVALTDARKAAGEAGVAYGQVLQKSPTDAAAQTGPARAYELATIRATLIEKQLALADVNFEITKRESFADDPDLPALKKQRDQIQDQIKQLQAALPQQ